MKIEMTKKLRFSPDGLRNLLLDKGEVIGVGENGLTQDNLDRLVKLQVARVLEVADIPVAESAEADNDDDEPDDAPVDFMDINDKSELEAFARENYDVELDKRKSIKKMKIDLEEEIATQPDVPEEEVDHDEQ